MSTEFTASLAVTDVPVTSCVIRNEEHIIHLRYEREVNGIRVIYSTAIGQVNYKHAWFSIEEFSEGIIDMIEKQYAKEVL